MLLKSILSNDEKRSIMQFTHAI